MDAYERNYCLEGVCNKLRVLRGLVHHGLGALPALMAHVSRPSCLTLSLVITCSHAYVFSPRVKGHRNCWGRAGHEPRASNPPHPPIIS